MYPWSVMRHSKYGEGYRNFWPVWWHERQILGWSELFTLTWSSLVPWYTSDKAAQHGALCFSLTSYSHIWKKPNTLEHKQDAQLPSLQIIWVTTAVCVYLATFGLWCSYWTQKSHRIHLWDDYENGLEARVMLWPIVTEAFSPLLSC